MWAVVLRKAQKYLSNCSYDVVTDGKSVWPRLRGLKGSRAIGDEDDGKREIRVVAPRDDLIVSWTSKR